MKILYGITKSNFGGAQRYVFDMAKEAKARGHETAVLCGGDGVLVEKCRQEGIEVLQIEALGRDILPLEDVRSFFTILSILNEWEPDVFHINSSKMGGVGALAGRIMRIPHVVFTSHGWAFNESRPEWQKAVIKFLHWGTLLLAHKVICVSDGAKRDIENWPLVTKKVRVIRNGVESFNLLSRERARNELGITGDHLVFGSIAELHHIKGLDILLLAWSDFVKHSPAKLVILGGGDDKEFLEKLAESLGISDSVEFKGFVPEARQYLSAFDIFVLPSRSEGLPYAPLEAGIAKLPVIATSVGGIPEVIVSGVNGALVPAEDPEALLSSLILFRDNPRMRDRLGQELYKTVREKFSRQKMFDETFEVYK